MCALLNKRGITIEELESAYGLIVPKQEMDLFIMILKKLGCYDGFMKNFNRYYIRIKPKRQIWYGIIGATDWHEETDEFLFWRVLEKYHSIRCYIFYGIPNCDNEYKKLEFTKFSNKDKKEIYNYVNHALFYISIITANSEVFNKHKDLHEMWSLLETMFYEENIFI